jgi:hypothetical protein
MAGYPTLLGRSVKRLGVVVVTVLVCNAALTGPAWATTLKADPTKPSAGPAVEKGVRQQAVHGEVRGADKGEVQAQGVVRGSDKAVVTVKGHAPQPGNLANLNYDCLFVWSQFCQ